MTKKEMYARIATANADDAEIVAFCEHEIELLASRKSSKSPTKTQKENESIMATLVDFLTGKGEALTVTEILGSCEALSGYTNQKISALLRKLVESGKVEKSIEGKKAKFSAVA